MVTKSSIAHDLIILCASCDHLAVAITTNVTFQYKKVIVLNDVNIELIFIYNKTVPAVSISLWVLRKTGGGLTMESPRSTNKGD